MLQPLRSVATALAVVGVGLASGFTTTSTTTSASRWLLAVPVQLPQHENLCHPNSGSFRPRSATGLCATRGDTNESPGEADTLKADAAALKAKAEKLRSEIEAANETRKTAPPAGGDGASPSAAATAVAPAVSPWAIVPSGDDDPNGDGDDNDGVEEYRLYCDVGREPGTWMDPRWGASGKRIEFTLDVALRTDKGADPEIASKMVKDNSMGKSSSDFGMDTARFARLRDGFDKMECTGAAFRIDQTKNSPSTNTIRMLVEVEGTTKADMYGDVSIPAGCLYFSLPTFGRGVANLSTKPGVISVRQVGWHTGWRREESRILGVFTAKKLAEAKRRDAF